MSFTFIVSAADWGRITPLIVLAGTALLVLLADLLLTRPAQKQQAKSGALPMDSMQAPPNTLLSFNFLALPALSLLGILGAFAATIVLFFVGDHQAAFNSMIGSDGGSLYAYIIILSASFLGVLLSPGYLSRLNILHQGEYYALMLLATVGMMIMAAATSFLTIFLGIEMLSLALYILCGFVARRITSQEAGMKYFLLSSFASAFLLYGIAMTYGATGNTSFAGIRGYLSAHTASTTLLLIGMGLLIVGFAFKVSAVPFQAWTPDVYEGAPAPVTAFMSVGTKAAALIAFARVFDVALLPIKTTWEPVVWAIAILTIVGGNVLALAQNNVKRLLAYSSIAHAGYLLIGVVVGGTIGLSAILFYLLCYTFLNLGAFGVVSVLEKPDNSGNSLSEIRGLWYRQPVLAGLLALFMVALAGFPPMAGFAAKYYIFYAALVGGHPELLIIGVVASVLGMYYYLRVIASMFMEREVAPTPGQAPGAVPTGSAGRRISSRLSNAAPAGTATAVAVKPSTAGRTKPPSLVKPVESKPIIAWTTWLALYIALAGTFLMGTILPFWLVTVAQQGTQMMLH
ncbi:MAG TPA: NADH-quinone oxidoreductase subunit N [Ktedonobacteraceae bacterium]|jgi:NADH-quinone oxidoreductase subunit N|nr:NADH-quinone oxidoreductase subunit N [Ktedonobacteraceae bacterium]